ncbi:MAG TPA: type II CAAX endopeptidase family protein [Nocardioides sp.]|uniref:CPBP family intramembrane glutamic endopeptidase n=1 Tax=uncultured Nocardioides sp. TaxID=198441 RepID=UPI000ED06770|nr:type II CAAX endopeptidase family protein [uncultured Nocardioides sp.]HCB06722.1 CPBP family intramembrane metalloprotease domain-containing protein [Nocardioides sp.]HRD60119.1 type II CAAX endopeptidase family protein [Nocardioides sp.]HRI96578.1 type II CAAX endopeptidase family protein [Nocardioides sp.]HRK45006.1 type II CAAX endopeptidase family protein [Nocardioides sp.]
MERREYHLIQRVVGRWGPDGWWRPVLGIPTLVVMMLLVVQVALIVALTLGFLVTGSSDVTDDVQRVLDTDHVTPAGLAYLNLSLAAAIPVVMAISYVFHRLRPGWVASVLGRMRWKWLFTCLGLSVVALAATLIVSSFLPAQGEGTDMSSSVNAWTPEVRNFLLVIVFLTPLQAAGEEYAFRGYLTQAFGGLFRSRVAAVLLPALLFALAHGAQDLPIFFDRFAFGLVAGVLVIATGGLEAGIAMHVLNNVLAFGLALAFSDMSSALNPTGGSWWNIPVTLTQSLVYLGLAIWTARKLGIATTVSQGPNVLEASEPRV